MPAELDPVEAVIAAEQREDHARARGRGERLRLLSDGIVSQLQAEGLLRGAPRDARVLVFHELASELFGNQSIDGPSSAWEGWQ